jgi:NitT/TauT family transport system substrate-binding protein
VKYTDIDPAARFGMLADEEDSGDRDLRDVDAGRGEGRGRAGRADFPARQQRLSALRNGIVSARGLSSRPKPRKVKGFVKASLQGWKDTIANPDEAADIVMKHVKGLDRRVRHSRRSAIVNALVATPEARAKGLGIIDDKLMAAERRPDRQNRATAGKARFMI